MDKVTVFGGSSPSPEDYSQALQLGRLLGAAGYTVLTGGYMGCMEAVSRGAAESGGHVIGITCNEIEAWRPVLPNAWVQEEWRYASLRERMIALIQGSEAAIALPGGPGTLAELSLMWTLLLTGAISPRALILVGPGWQATFQQFYRSFDGYVQANQRKWVTFAPDVETAVSYVKQLFVKP